MTKKEKILSEMKDIIEHTYGGDIDKLIEETKMRSILFLLLGVFVTTFGLYGLFILSKSSFLILLSIGIGLLLLGNYLNNIYRILKYE